MFGPKRDPFTWAKPPLDAVQLAGKKVAVVGGTDGLGRAIALAAAARGAQVVVVGRTNRVEGVPGVSFVKADLSLMRDAAALGAGDALPQVRCARSARARLLRPKPACCSGLRLRSRARCSGVHFVRHALPQVAGWPAGWLGGRRVRSTPARPGVLTPHICRRLQDLDVLLFTTGIFASPKREVSQASPAARAPLIPAPCPCGLHCCAVLRWWGRWAARALRRRRRPPAPPFLLRPPSPRVPSTLLAGGSTAHRPSLRPALARLCP